MLIVQKYIQRLVFSTLVPFLIELLSLGWIFKPEVNGRFLIAFSVSHGNGFGSPGSDPAGMASSNTFQREKRIRFKACDYVMHRENSCLFLRPA